MVMNKYKLFVVLVSMVLSIGFLQGKRTNVNTNEAALACWYMSTETSGGTSAAWGAGENCCWAGSGAAFSYSAVAIAKAGAICASSGIGIGVGVVLGL